MIGVNPTRVERTFFRSSATAVEIATGQAMSKARQRRGGDLHVIGEGDDSERFDKIAILCALSQSYPHGRLTVAC